MEGQGDSSGGGEVVACWEEGEELADEEVLVVESYGEDAKWVGGLG